MRSRAKDDVLGWTQLIKLWYQNQWRVGVFVACVQNFYSKFQKKLCSIGGILVLRLPWYIYLWDFLACIIIWYINFAYILESLQMKSRDWFTLYKLKWCDKVLGLGFLTYNLGTQDKDNSHKGFKYVIIVNVGNKIDMWFWCCWRLDSGVFDKVKLKVSRTWLILCGYSGYPWMSL